MLTVHPAPPHIFKWERFGGYEVSTRGDRRFSALNAILSDGRSIEMHYQLDNSCKGYDHGGTDWKLGKGKPPLTAISKDELWEAYLSLWRVWASNNVSLMRDLYVQARHRGNTLSDQFATTDINQARALAIILTEMTSRGKP